MRVNMALSAAAAAGDTLEVKKLLEASASVDEADDNDWTALMHASLNGHSACVELLLRASASVDQADNDGYTALMAASESGHTTVEDLLGSWMLLSPLMKAVVLCQPEQVRTLLHSG